MDHVSIIHTDSGRPIVSLVRNLTWTLLRPEVAYAEWYRGLRPGGVLLNFDADYGTVDFTKFASDCEQHAHADLDDALLWKGYTSATAVKL